MRHGPGISEYLQGWLHAPKQSFVRHLTFHCEYYGSILVNTLERAYKSPARKTLMRQERVYSPILHVRNHYDRRRRIDMSVEPIFCFGQSVIYYLGVTDRCLPHHMLKRV